MRGAAVGLSGGSPSPRRPTQRAGMRESAWSWVCASQIRAGLCRSCRFLSRFPTLRFLGTSPSCNPRRLSHAIRPSILPPSALSDAISELFPFFHHPARFCRVETPTSVRDDPLPKTTDIDGCAGWSILVIVRTSVSIVFAHPPRRILMAGI